MKLGKKESGRWESLAELFADFHEQFDPLSFQGHPIEEVPALTESATTNRSQPGFEEDEAAEIREYEAVEFEEFGSDLEAATLDHSEPKPENFTDAKAFFIAAPWTGHASSARAEEPTTRVPASQRAEKAMARDFFSTAPWGQKSQESPVAFSAKRGGLDKLMALATEQAVSTSRERAATSGPALRAEIARVFFSQAPWKQSA